MWITRRSWGCPCSKHHSSARGYFERGIRRRGIRRVFEQRSDHRVATCQGCGVMLASPRPLHPVPVVESHLLMAAASRNVHGGVGGVGGVMRSGQLLWYHLVGSARFFIHRYHILNGKQLMGFSSRFWFTSLPTITSRLAYSIHLLQIIPM